MATEPEVVPRKWNRLLEVLRKPALREVAGVIAGLALLVWMYYFSPIKLVPMTPFWVLAVLPGIIGLLYHFMSLEPRFRARQKSVEAYLSFCQQHDEWWRRTWSTRVQNVFGGSSTGSSHQTGPTANPFVAFDNLGSHGPSAAAALWAAMLLTAVFSIAALFADLTKRPLDQMPAGFPLLIGQIEVQTPAEEINPPAATPTPATTTGTPAARGTPATAPGTPATTRATEARWRKALTTNAVNGLLFAALGAYVSVLWRMVMRINANALTYRFLFTAALQSAIALVIGLTAGQLDLFGFLKADGPREVLFFLTGLFTDWAIGALRSRARTVFQAGEIGCERLPLCLVDGLDDGVIDILDELGIWDVQHLATMDPGELTIRSLHPFNRVLDWIDQAILISTLRQNIRVARELGIRGAIDMMSLYSYTRKTNGKETAAELSTQAAVVLNALGDKSGMTKEAIQILAASFWFDYTVNLLYSMWQRIGEIGEAKPGTAVP
jgi:hypothetical protein